MPTWLVTRDDMLIFWIGAGKQGLLWSRGKPLCLYLGQFGSVSGSCPSDAAEEIASDELVKGWDLYHHYRAPFLRSGAQRSRVFGEIGAKGGELASKRELGEPCGNRTHDTLIKSQVLFP